MARKPTTKAKHVEKAVKDDGYWPVCQCCERELKNMVAWLELDQRNNTYHDRGDVPPENSQGWFPFGLTCADRALKEAAAKRGCR